MHEHKLRIGDMAQGTSTYIFANSQMKKYCIEIKFK